MVEDQGGKKEDKFDFTLEGEALGYITLEQARVLAIQHARDHTDFYGAAYAQVSLVWEVMSQEEGEDYYDIRLSFRPAGRFRGEPGIEQFIIDKTGNIQVRQLLDEPTLTAAPEGTPTPVPGPTPTPSPAPRTTPSPSATPTPMPTPVRPPTARATLTVAGIEGRRFQEASAKLLVLMAGLAAVAAVAVAVVLATGSFG